MKKIDDPVLYFQNQVDQWQEEMDRECNAANRATCADLRNEAAKLNAQFQRILYAYQEQGAGLTLASGHNHCVVLPDASEPGRFRYQTFHETGFTGHTTRDTVEAVLLEAFRDGFRNIDQTDALERFSKTPEWEKGSLINDLVRKVNCGQLTHSQANEQYEAGLARIFPSANASADQTIQ